MKIAKDSLWILAARVGAQGMAALVTLLLARRLGSGGFGEYAVLAAVLFVGNMLTTFGTDMSAIREIAAHDDVSMLPSALAIQLALSLLFIALTWMTAPLLLNENADAVSALRLYVFALIPLAFFTIFTSVLRGKQFADAYAWLNLAGSVLKLVLVWVFIAPGADIVTLALLLLLIQFVTALIGAFICHRKVNGFWRGWRLQKKDIFHLLKTSSPLAILSLLAMFQQKLGVLMLSAIGGPAVTGIFSAAARTVEAAETGHGAVFTAMYPEMSRFSDNGRIRAAFLILLSGAVAGAVVLSAWAMPITRILFGRGYEASVPVLQILAWMMIPYTVNTFLTLKFVALKDEMPVLRASLLSLAVLIPLSLWWIPRAGAPGAGGAALIAEAAQSVFLILQWRAAWVFRIIPINKI